MRTVLFAILMLIPAAGPWAAPPAPVAPPPARTPVEVVVPLPPALLMPPPARQYRAIQRSTICRQADGGLRIDSAGYRCAEGERAEPGRRLSTSGD